MRILTIKRNKTFVGCLGNFKVYIEDRTQNDLLINDTPCRLLGSLKNNEEKSFEISEDAAKVFVIAGKVSKSFCNEFYQLPAGEDPIYLSGKPRYNPAAGNAFRFDNNDSEEVRENRKKSTRKGVVVLVVAVLIGLLVGSVIGKFIGRAIFSGSDPDDKTFTASGMSITLTEDFKEENIGNFTAAYSSNKIAVFATKEPLSYFDNGKNMTVAQYAELLLSANQLSSSDLKKTGNLTYFEYEAEGADGDQIFRYRAYLFKSNDAFWMIQFASDTQIFDRYSSQIINWAKTVTFH